MSRSDKINAFVNDTIMYWLFAIMAIVFAVGASGYVALGLWSGAFYTYLAATAFRLLAGRVMIQMISGDPATVRQLRDGVPNACLVDLQLVNSWNDKYHRVVVIALNVGIGVVFLAATIWYRMWEGAFATALTFVVYSIAAKFTRPNTFGARVRSMFLTIYLAGALAHSAELPYGLVILGVVLGTQIAFFRLQTLQRRFGWKTR